MGKKAEKRPFETRTEVSDSQYQVWSDLLQKLDVRVVELLIERAYTAGSVPSADIDVLVSRSRPTQIHRIFAEDWLAHKRLIERQHAERRARGLEIAVKASALAAICSAIAAGSTAIAAWTNLPASKLPPPEVTIEDLYPASSERPRLERHRARQAHRTEKWGSVFGKTDAKAIF